MMKITGPGSDGSSPLHSDGAESQRGWDWMTIAIMLLGLVLASTAVSELWTWHPWR